MPTLVQSVQNMWSRWGLTVNYFWKRIESTSVLYNTVHIYAPLSNILSPSSLYIYIYKYIWTSFNPIKDMAAASTTTTLLTTFAVCYATLPLLIPVFTPSLLLKFCTHCIRCVVPPNWGGQPINWIVWRRKRSSYSLLSRQIFNWQ